MILILLVVLKRYSPLFLPPIIIFAPTVIDSGKVRIGIGIGIGRKSRRRYSLPIIWDD